MGRLNYIARFISNLSETCKPLFRLLRKDALVKWDEDCQNAFEQIKQYLASPPVLVPPVPGHPLILYLTIHEESLGAMLAQQPPGSREHAIYYLSKKCTPCEAKYTIIERTCCALVWVLHRLRQYTLHYEILLVSENDPLKYLLDRPTLIGRVSKWQLQLAEFDIRYSPQKSVKGRAIADYLAEYPSSDTNPLETELPDEHIMNTTDRPKKWTMYFDGAVNLSGSGIGAILISPDDQYYPVAAKVTFPCTNNIAEYEACILGLQTALELDVDHLDVYGDSAQLIAQR
uniref:RNase H type-1 domain-containing protein n=1 Tax=Medinilla magnifica TaxID=1799599 RepID=A0A7D9MX44_9MYRT|nr:hypothetical protein [Medinilla magnifica]